MFKIKLIFYFCLIFLLLPQEKAFSSNKKAISPITFGILDAKDGIEAYDILFKTHTYANSQNLPVVYKGVKEIRIEIPSNAKSIPLSSYTDFSNTQITVLNRKKDLFLFTLYNEMMPIDIKPQSIDLGEYKKTIIEKGKYLLSVEDQNPWVLERVGYGGAFMRKDIFFVVNGQSKNHPICPYNNKQSNLRCKYVKVDTSKKVIKNLTFLRDSLSKSKTFMLKVCGQYNVLIENIDIKTPENDSLYGDACIQINDSYKVKLNTINICGTYSQLKKYGYGISMNNVSDFEADNLNATAKWGVFGTYNVSNVTIKNSILNRFDIHCYGKNIISSNCIYKDVYNQYSSVFGFIKYYNCTFDHCTPVLLEPSYNAYTPFYILIKNCNFIVSEEKNYIIYARKMVKGKNEREELQEIYWPSVTIDKMRIIDNDNVNKLLLFYNDKSYYDRPIVGNLSIELCHIDYLSKNTNEKCLFKLSSQLIKARNNVFIKTHKIDNNLLFKNTIYYENSIGN